MYDLIERFSTCKRVKYFCYQNNGTYGFIGFETILSFCWWEPAEIGEQKIFGLPACGIWMGTSGTRKGGSWGLFSLFHLFPYSEPWVGAPICPSLVFFWDGAHCLEDDPNPWVTSRTLGDNVKSREVCASEWRYWEGPGEVTKMV